MTTLTVCLTPRGFNIKEKLPTAHANYLEEMLTQTHISKIGGKTFSFSLCNFCIVNDKVFYSRFSNLLETLKKMKYKVNFRNLIQCPAKIAHVSTSIEPTDNQQVVKDYLFANIYTEAKRVQGMASCILVMDTGAGKTFTAGTVIASLKVPTLIIVPGKGIINEWVKMLKTFKGMTVGEYHSKRKRDGDIVIMTAKSAIGKTMTFNKKVIKYYEYFAKFGLVVYDEIHNYATQCYQELLWRTHFTYGLGLTATPDERLDHMDPIYIKHVGPIVMAKELPNYNQQAIVWKGKVLAVKYSGSVQYTKELPNTTNDWMSTQKMNKQFAQDPHRNMFILGKIGDMLTRFKNVYIFGEHREYLNTLWAEVPDSGIIMGGVSEADYAEAITKKVIFVTYGYGKEGISIPKMNAIIFVHPRRNKMRQILGRILRSSGDPDIEREIVDIIDVKTKVKSQYTDRKKIYLEKKFEIEEIDVSYTQYL